MARHRQQVRFDVRFGHGLSLATFPPRIRDSISGPLRIREPAIRAVEYRLRSHDSSDGRLQPGKDSLCQQPAGSRCVVALVVEEGTFALSLQVLQDGQKIQKRYLEPLRRIS